jgi:signal transduction histidine kinase
MRELFRVPPAGLSGSAQHDRCSTNLLDKPAVAPGMNPHSVTPDQLAALLQRLDLLEHRFQETLEAEKLESLAEWAAGAGHEINNPLAVITGRAQLLARDEPDPERRRELAVIRTQAQRVHEMIADLMLFARPPEPELEPCPLAELLAQIVRELKPRAEERQVQVHLDLPGVAEVEADPVQLAVAIRAVCDNALEAAQPGGRVSITCRTSLQAAVGPPERWIEVVVSDDGPGISAEVRRHLFDPFYSGRQAGRGLGMGLAKCWRIVTRHGGQLGVTSEPDTGTTVVMRLPQQRTS